MRRGVWRQDLRARKWRSVTLNPKPYAPLRLTLFWEPQGLHADSDPVYRTSSECDRVRGTVRVYDAGVATCMWDTPCNWAQIRRG